jgi:hypothetical protein
VLASLLADGATITADATKGRCAATIGAGTTALAIVSGPVDLASYDTLLEKGGVVMTMASGDVKRARSTRSGCSCVLQAASLRAVRLGDRR